MFELGFRNDFNGLKDLRGREGLRGQPFRPALGQDILTPLLTIALPALLNTGVQAYGAKRAADRIKQAKERAQEQLAQAEASQAAAAEAKKKADQAIKAQLLEQQGLSPTGAPLPNQGKILGMDPIIVAGAGLAILGIGTAIFMATRN